MSLTTKLNVTLTHELIKAVKERAKELFGTRKGYISHYVEMVLRNDLHLGHEELGVETR